MNRYAFICMMLLGMSLSVAAQDAQEVEKQFSGNALISRCEKVMAPVFPLTPQDSLEIGYCLGLVDGEAFALNSTNWIVLPTHGTSGQWVRVVLKYLKDHPEKLAERDCILVEEALLAAFPGPEVIKRRNQNK